MENRQFTPGTVAKALNVEVNTLRTWTQRGYTPAATNEGTWRKYNMLEVAQIAALKSLAAHMDPKQAGAIIGQASANQQDFWRKAIGGGRQHIYVFVTKYDGHQGTTAFLYAGDKPDSVENLLLQPEEAGELVGDKEPQTLPPLIPNVARYDVGPAVSRALAALTE